jgi:hypothetical protein
MTDTTHDDLVKRLRDLGDHGSYEPHMHHAAADRIEELEAKLAKAVGALGLIFAACDQGRMVPRSGVGGMTIEANIRGSVYTGVPAWPIEEARTTLAELKGDTP